MPAHETTTLPAGRLLRWAAAVVAYVSCPALALAAEPCPDAHRCFDLPHGRLAIPAAYTRALMPGGESLGNFAPSVAWFSFWMPDGAPAGNVKAESFYMYPDAFEPRARNQPPVAKDPPPANPRTMVSISFCVRKVPGEDFCPSPDKVMANMVNLNKFQVEHNEPGPVTS